MENNEINAGNANGGAVSSDRPKPLRKLVRVKPQGEYQGKHETPPKKEQEIGVPGQNAYHGKHEAEPKQTHGSFGTVPAKKYRPKHDPSVDEYMDKYNHTEEEFEISSQKEKDPDKLKNIIVKIVAVAASVFIIGALILNMPICVDRKTDKNVSLIYLFKHWQPMAKEGQLDKSDIQNSLNSQIINDDDYNDGLDLPQLIEGQYSVLFLGFEPDEYNTDIIWVMQFDIGHGGLNILQIPRDTCLPDYTSSPAKRFNSIYSLGDSSITPPIQRTVNAVQENFGIPIDAYVTTTCDDIVEIVDIIGGIPIHLDHEIDFEPSAPGTQFIPSGDVVLSGEQSVWFMRYRSGWLQGDIGRMQNQRRFMAAAMKKLFDIVEDGGKLKLYSYIKEMYDKDLLYTDMSLDDMSKLADFASTISMEDARVNMVPGEDALFYASDGNEYSVYSVHKRAAIDMLNKYYRPYQTDMGWYDTTIVELVQDYQYDVYDDTGIDFDELESATEPPRNPG